MGFLICGECQRHVKDSDSSCPFCAGSLEGAAPAGNPSARNARSRLAVLFGATALVTSAAAGTTSCAGSTTSNGLDSGSTSPTSTQTAVAAYGVAVPEDSGVKDSGGAVAAYGAPQFPDSGHD